MSPPQQQATRAATRSTQPRALHRRRHRRRATTSACCGGGGGSATFVQGNAHVLPFEGGSFDVVYEQDPDALANGDRIHVFREVARVLRPGGLLYFHHHWIPGPDWPADVLEPYLKDPVTGGDRMHFEGYVEDMKAAGLEVASAEACTELARSHLAGVERLMRQANGGALPDLCFEKTCACLERGLPFGILAVAYRL